MKDNKVSKETGKNFGQELYPLSVSQTVIADLEDFNKDYNSTVSGLVKIGSAGESLLVDDVLNILIKTHESLRLRVFRNEDQVLHQYIEEFSPQEFKTTTVFTKSEFDNYVKEFASTPINYTEQLYCMEKLIFEKNIYVLEKSNHVISDAWSLNLLCKQLKEGTEALRDNKDWIPETSSFINFILNDVSYHNSEKFMRDKKFWLDELPHYEPVLLSSTFGVANKIKTFNAKRIRSEIKLGVANKIVSDSYNQNTTPFSTFFGLFSLCYSRFIDSSEFYLGTFFANRAKRSDKKTIGMLINTTPIPVSFDFHISLNSNIKAISDQMLEIMRHQKFTYRDLSQSLSERGIEDTVLLDTIFSYQYMDSFDDGSWLSSNSIADSMLFSVRQLPSKCEIIVDYNPNQISSDFAQKIVNHYIEIVEKYAELGGENTSFFDFTSREDQKFFHAQNNTYNSRDTNSTIIDLFEKRVSETPDKIALNYKGGTLTYAELNSKVNQLANYLLENHDLKRDDVIGVMVERNEKLVISILAVLKAGAAYMPISSIYPNDRIDYMMSNGNSKLLIASESNVKNLDEQFKTITIDNELTQQEISDMSISNPEIDITFDNLIYVIYTSGTTGKPKGIMAQHSLITLCHEYLEGVIYEKEKNDLNFVSLTDSVFDPFSTELFVSFMSGMTLFLFSSAPDTFVQYIKENKINILQCPPSKLFYLCPNLEELNQCDSLIRIMIGGESLDPRISSAFAESDRIKLFSVYGLTETTVWSTAKLIDSKDILSKNIGKALKNQTTYILSKSMNLLPVGAIGELYIGGTKVVRGYANNEKLTNERFLANPFQTKEQKAIGYNGGIYKTGDLARYLPNGDIEYIGRSDFQVKIRGFRVELSEIEARLSAISGIKQVTVQAVDNANGDKQIIGYYVSDKPIDREILQKELENSLPDYMIPRMFVHLDALPLTINGKLNRRALPKPEIKISANYAAPTNSIEQTVVDAFSKVLNIDAKMISVTDSFFNIGGSSLSAIKLVGELRSAQLDYKVADIFRFKTPKIISENANTIKSKNYKAKELYKSPRSFMNFYELERNLNVPINIMNFKIDYYGVPNDIMSQILKNVIDAHPVLKINYKEIDNDIYIQRNDNREIEIKTEKIPDEYFDDFISNITPEPMNHNIDPLIRLTLYTSSRKSIANIQVSHAILDAISSRILGQEINEAISSFKETGKLDFEHQSKVADTIMFDIIDDFWGNKEEEEYYAQDSLLSIDPDNIIFKSDEKVEDSVVSATVVDINDLSQLKTNSVGITDIFMGAFLICYSQIFRSDNAFINMLNFGREEARTSNAVGYFLKNKPYLYSIQKDNTITEFLQEVSKVDNTHFVSDIYDIQKVHGRTPNALVNIVYDPNSVQLNKDDLTLAKEIDQFLANPGVAYYGIFFDVKQVQPSKMLIKSTIQSSFDLRLADNFADLVAKTFSEMSNNPSASVQDIIEVILPEGGVKL